MTSLLPREVRCSSAASEARRCAVALKVAIRESQNAVTQQQQVPIAPFSATLPTSLNFLAPLTVDGMVRVGNSHDGGYVIPTSSILAVDTLLSFGISADWSFEEHFKALNPGIIIHAYDHTISEQKFKLSLLRGLVKFAFGKMGTGELKRRFKIWRGYKSFFQQKAIHFKERIHNRVDGTHDATLEKIFDRTESTKIFLKIDIEGSEYRIIDDIVKYADRIIGMVIEFHETDPLRDTFCKAVRTLQKRFEIVHLHGNNFVALAGDNLPEVLEITFANRRDVEGSARRQHLPLPELDHPNDPDRADYVLSFSL